MMPNRFLILLIPLGLMIFTQPLVAEGILPPMTGKILKLLVLIGAFRIFQGDRKLLLIIGGLFVVAAAAIPLGGSTSSQLVLTVGVVAQIAAMTITLVYISREAIHDERVTKDTMMGIVAVYLLIGIGLAQVYELIELAYPGAFTNLVGATEAQVHAELVYYSLVTLTTLGYGDIAPVLPLARTLGVMEAILGQFFVAAVIGLLISRQSAQRNAPETSKTPPAVPTEGS
jgi:hypothetical protein